MMIDWRVLICHTMDTVDLKFFARWKAGEMSLDKFEKAMSKAGYKIPELV